mmetsp:Transcript_4241/g.6273  ORF Transcript_4241/g.6273 Transcript_4241/m.6273 type:complete len:340 (-) Transcript_4241:136-1155(-)|eukprot:CAMPEP_0172427642 /NCGR_PEP_ID=MMETSP1064-20121228/42817_1 /TAXON_ID=202472 /ORGANISM="Aulacoseira subarctica , Strain CCAP 1002/5" /LENGTH=339 /DNA_ID=CAMNT_0013171941 /DNA_START=70 /DNA_END=1089 /DNA_ORIENTATION=-
MSRSHPTSDRNAPNDGDSPLRTPSAWIIGNESGFETCASSSFDLNDTFCPLPLQQHVAVAQQLKQGSHSVKRRFSSPPEDCESSFPSFSEDAAVSHPRNNKRLGPGKRPLDSRSVFLREERARLLQNSPSTGNNNKNLLVNHPHDNKHQLLQQQNIIFANNGQQQIYNMQCNDAYILPQQQQKQQQGNSFTTMEYPILNNNPSPIVPLETKNKRSHLSSNNTSTTTPGDTMIQQQELAQQQFQQQPILPPVTESAVFVEQVQPQWLWHRTCDSIEIPPSHFVTITDSNGVLRRYKRFYAAVSMPYELASTYDAMSLYTAARSAFDSAMVQNNCPASNNF